MSTQNPKKPKLTPWFSFDVKPSRVGVYEVRDNHFHWPLHSFWDGNRWCRRTALGVEKAASPRYSRRVALGPVDAWRGLAEEPKP